MTNPTGLNIVKWNILLFIWADDVLYSKDLQPPTFFSFLFFFFFFFFFVNLHFLWACNRYMQSLPSLRLYITIQKTKLCHLYFLPRTRKLKMLAIYCYLSPACFSVFLHYKGSEEIKTLWTFYRLMCCFPTPISDMIKWGLFTLSALAFKNDRHSLKT